MKNLIIIFSILLITHSLTAQNSGEITYMETIKLKIEMDDMPAGIDLTGMLPDSRSEDKILTFNETVSLYEDGENETEDTELTSDDGSFKMVIMDDDIENKLYVDQKTRKSISQEGFMSKAFVVSDEVPKYKWKITNEKVKYLDYECIKATSKNEKDEDIVAWFAPAIRTTAGPSIYNQLPGAILMLSVDGDRIEIKATKVDLKEIKKIKAPKDGKKVTSEEYEKIMEEKMKEMENQRGGGTTISIRG